MSSANALTESPAPELAASPTAIVRTLTERSAPPLASRSSLSHTSADAQPYAACSRVARVRLAPVACSRYSPRLPTSSASRAGCETCATITPGSPPASSSPPAIERHSSSSGSSSPTTEWPPSICIAGGHSDGSYAENVSRYSGWSSYATSSTMKPLEGVASRAEYTVPESELFDAYRRRNVGTSSRVHRRTNSERSNVKKVTACGVNALNASSDRRPGAVTRSRRPR